MIVEGMGVIEQAAALWELATALARGQPVGAAIVLLLLADGVFAAAGAVLDRWESGGARRIKPVRSSRSEPPPPACAAGAGR